MKRISRRTFLKLAGVSAAAAALYESSGSIIAALNLIDQTTPPGEEVWVPSICQLCPAECGLQVRVVGGAAVKVNGNRHNPNNNGRTCPKGQAALQLLYSPDRVQTPLKRVGERGEGRWEPVSWDQAIGDVAARLRDIRSAGTPERIAFFYDRPTGLLGETIEYFCQALGTPNTVNLHPDALSQAVLLTQGWLSPPALDIDHTRYLLSFNYALLDSAQPSTHLLGSYAFMRRGRPGIRARFVQIEPRLSVTALKSDEWVPVHVGTEGALALGLAWVILDEHLYDRAFVAERCYGFEPWSEAVLQSYSPPRVSELTGVPEETIKRLAREFAGTRPSIAIGGEAVSRGTNGLASQLAIQSLNALVGSVDVPGGIMMQRPVPLTPFPALQTDEVTAQGLAQPRIDGAEDFVAAPSVPANIPGAILNGDPYPVEALLLYRANPIHDLANGEAWRDALDTVPLIVSFDEFIEDSDLYADYILPNHTFLERWIAAPVYPSVGYPMLAVGQPAVEPLYDTRASGDLLIQLTHQIGGAPAASFPWNNYLELLRFRTAGLMASERGSIPATTADEFWQELAARGVWTDNPYIFAGGPEGDPGQWSTVLATPSGKFELTPHALEQETALAPPYYEPPVYAGQEDEFPFNLQLFTLMSQGVGPGASNLPHLHSLYGLHVKQFWGNWLEIDPETAHEMGIEDEDKVWVESPAGRIQIPARLYPGDPHGVVGIPSGLGHVTGGQWSAGIGSNANHLVSSELVDELTGLVALQGMRVKVTKAEEES
jgi:anaerobic selenocysteine-containing dehydrogenase